jgi:carbamoyl-phosphate synthase large subunit
MKAAAEASLAGKLHSAPFENKFNLLLPKWFGVKSPQFSWARLRGAYPFLGPEMRSVGEVATLANSFEEALVLSWLSVSGNRLPSKNNYILIYNPLQKEIAELNEATHALADAGYKVITVDGMSVKGAEVLSETKVVENLVNNRVDMVITTGYAPEKDYRIRRYSADLVIPLVLDHRLGLELTKALLKFNANSVSVKDMKEFWRDITSITIAI